MKKILVDSLIISIIIPIAVLFICVFITGAIGLGMMVYDIWSIVLGDFFNAS